MKRNEDLQQDVEDAIKGKPLLHAEQIGVIARDGVITITGIVDSYTKKLEAENAAKNVAGVTVIIEKINIKLASQSTNYDNEIGEFIKVLRTSLDIPNNAIQIRWENRWITLDGEQQRSYLREGNKMTINNLFDVKGGTSHVSINCSPHDDFEKRTLQLALIRKWSLNVNLSLLKYWQTG